MNIYIFSKPVHSGKTTELRQWCNRHKNVTGILMPDMNGKRMFLNIRTKEIFAAACEDANITTEPLVPIGRFHFYAAAFLKANTMLIDESMHGPEWMVIDEVGRLEIGKMGFYPAVKAIIIDASVKNIVLVVRDSLFEPVISFFEIKDHHLIHTMDDLK